MSDRLRSVVSPTRRAAFALLSVSLLALSARGEDMLLGGDAHVSAANPTKAFGNQGSLRVATDNRMFVRFDLGNLPLGTTSAQVSKAVLTLYVNDVRTAGSIQFRRAAGPWAEATLTEANAPGLLAGLDPAAIAIGASDKNAFRSIDVTAYAKTWLDGAPNDGIVLLAASPLLNVSFDSKENGKGSHEPRLEIVLASLPGPSGPPGPPGPGVTPLVAAAPGVVAGPGAATAVSMNYIICAYGNFPSPSGPIVPEPFMGQVKLFAGNNAPSGWMFCHGQTLPINTNTALFALLGTAYGGDGVVTFKLPDLRGRVVTGAQ